MMSVAAITSSMYVLMSISAKSAVLAPVVAAQVQRVALPATRREVAQEAMPLPRAAQLPVEQVERLAARTAFGQPRLDVQAAFADDALVLADGPVGARIHLRALAEVVAVTVRAATRSHVHGSAVVEVAHLGARYQSGLKTRPVAALG